MVKKSAHPDIKLFEYLSGGQRALSLSEFSIGEMECVTIRAMPTLIFLPAVLSRFKETS